MRPHRMWLPAALLIGAGCRDTSVNVTPRPTTPARDSSTASSKVSTDWSGYTAGVQRAGWAVIHDPTPYYRVVQDPGATSGQFLQWSALRTSRNRFGLAYLGFGNVGDQEVYTEFRVTQIGLGTSPDAYFLGVAAVRLGGSASDEHGYMARLVYDPRFGNREFHLNMYRSGASTRLAQVTYPWSEGTWYAVRMQAIGTTIRARIWPRGTPEAAT